ncbi:MAG: glycosyltransferase family 9 protein [Flavisolibacter sp.]|nr:glycosyltransferase family 9 protein [Flavisolibacter sp.]
MKILVRLPNWLGDMVMSVGFLHQLQKSFPEAAISVIAKKGIHELLPFFPPTKHQFVFDKEAYKGLKGLWHFGHSIKSIESFDLFFCLPPSFSAAFIGWATGVKKRIGYKGEGRSFLFTHAFTKPEYIHRAEQYTRLIEFFTGQKVPPPVVQLHHNFQKGEHIVVNINSEASSRRLTVEKAAALLYELQKSVHLPIILIGAPNEAPFVETALQKAGVKEGIINKAGQTTLLQLAELLATAQLVITTDSGPAHLANALGTKTIVLFGAGNEAETAPYEEAFRTVIRLGKLSCEPCQKNKCVRYDIPQCLQQLNIDTIVKASLQQIR